MDSYNGIRIKLSDYAPASALGERLRLDVADAVAAFGLPDEHELAWDELTFRRRLLDGCGFPAEDALALAMRPEIDLKDMLELVGRGCDPETATRILL